MESRQRITVLFLLLVSAALCSEETGGILPHDTRWNAEEGPYFITSDLVVPRNVRLTITEGTRVVVGTPSCKDTTVSQYDDVDSRTVAIKVYGSFICIGKSSDRIVFSPDSGIKADKHAWYGIVIDGAEDQFTEIAYTDISGACFGIVVRKCSPLIRNSIIEHNHIGIRCTDASSPYIYNCIISFNSLAGVKNESSNPCFSNNIIVFNRNHGLFCDGKSEVSFKYNCIYGNNDGDFMECDPELGHLTKKNKRGDSTDIFNNLRSDPVFSGSAAELSAMRKDASLPTEKHLIRNPALFSIIHDISKAKETFPTSNTTLQGRYRLSKYSPCIDAGDPSSRFKDGDGSRNDMGIWGGPQYLNRK